MYREVFVNEEYYRNAQTHKHKDKWSLTFQVTTLLTGSYEGIPSRIGRRGGGGE